MFNWVELGVCSPSAGRWKTGLICLFLTTLSCGFFIIVSAVGRVSSGKGKSFHNNFIFRSYKFFLRKCVSRKTPKRLNFFFGKFRLFSIFRESVAYCFFTKFRMFSLPFAKFIFAKKCENFRESSHLLETLTSAKSCPGFIVAIQYMHDLTEAQLSYFSRGGELEQTALKSCINFQDWVDFKVSQHLKLWFYLTIRFFKPYRWVF